MRNKVVFDGHHGSADNNLTDNLEVFLLSSRLYFASQDKSFYCPERASPIVIGTSAQGENPANNNKPIPDQALKGRHSRTS